MQRIEGKTRENNRTEGDVKLKVLAYKTHAHSYFSVQSTLSPAIFQNTIYSSCYGHNLTWNEELHDITVSGSGDSNKVSEVALGFIQNTD